MVGICDMSASRSYDDNDDPLVESARRLARELLTDIPGRVRHSEAVAKRAAALGSTVAAADRNTLIAVAWVHDIGYADDVKQTGFHPLDGALYLQATGWPDPICALVAHHSGARYVAAVRGLGHRLETFAFVEDAMSDALTIADYTAGPDGEEISVGERIDDMLQRHGPDSPNSKAHADREPYILAAADRVALRLAHPSS